MKILYVQYAGDFAEAYQRLYINNGKENYYGQKYSVGVVVDQARSGFNILVLTVKSDHYHHAKLEHNLESIGLHKDEKSYVNATKKIITDFAADLIILRTPDTKLLRFIRKKKIPVFPNLADSFEYKPKGLKGIKNSIRTFLLSRELKHKSIRWIANHQLNACKSLMSIGINPKKILPYDWKHNDSPLNWQKTIPSDFSNSQFKTIFLIWLLSVIHKQQKIIPILEQYKL